MFSKLNNMQAEMPIPKLFEVQQKSSDYRITIITEAVAEGTVLSHFDYENERDFPDIYSIQVSATTHAQFVPEFLKYINHSCSPNVFFDVEQKQLIALRDLQAGEELGFFYPSTEWHMDAPFDCHCESNECVGRIGGASLLTPEQKDKYRFTSFIDELYRQNRQERASLG